MCIFCSVGFSIPIVMWTFSLSFRVPSQVCTCSDTNLEKEAMKSKESRLDVSSVGHVLKLR